MKTADSANGTGVSRATPPSTETLLDLYEIVRGLAHALDALCAGHYVDAADKGINGIARALLDATDRLDLAMTAAPGTAAPKTDERMEDLVWCAQETGLCLDMLDAFTRDLDPVSQRAVLTRARAFARRFEVSAKVRAPSGDET